MRISEEGQDAEEDDENDIKSQAQPQSSIAINDTPFTGRNPLPPSQMQLNKDAFPNRSLSSSASSLVDEDQAGGGGSVASNEIGAGEGGGRGACVLQRAAMEIIDSEGSYVMDLQQVIEGYLFDWKERACLKLDELETLFGNLEQLYRVNSHLNERLKETQGDVELIAKCFLDLRDEFSVYETYW